MAQVLGGAISKESGNWAVLPAHEMSHGQCFLHMERVLGGATSKWEGNWAVLQANEQSRVVLKANGRGVGRG